MNRLSIKSDFEHRLGIPGRFTSPNKLFAFVLAALLTVALAFGISFVPESYHQDTALGILTRRGPIPFVTLGAFFWGVALIWLKSRKVSAQGKALTFLLSNNIGSQLFHSGIAKKWVIWIDDKVDQPQAFILINRLRAALASLHALGEPSAIPGLISSHTESDEVQVDESYSFPSMLLFLIPTLGFIGTVIGLSSSIGGFGSALNTLNADITALKSSLQGVTGGLSVAFDTTLFALVCALLLQLYTSLVRNRETKMLEDCNVFFQCEFLPNLTTPERAAELAEPTETEE